jgi:hypothetical protein
MSRSLYIAFLILAAAVSSPAQDSPAPAPKVGCGVLETDFINGHPQTQPVIFGKAFNVPGVRIQVLDAATRKPLSGNEVIVRYVWRWFRYPYPEHSFGVWSDAYDLVRCVTDKDGTVVVPEHEVVPSGWYKGKYLFGRKPGFRHLDISVGTKKSITHFQVSRNKLEKMRQSKKSDIVFNVSQ